MSVITVSELLQGVHRASGAQRMHADIWAQLAARGEVIGAHDLWIAATALAHGMGLATGNTREFNRVPGLRLIEPLA
jgi:predicted nucleic acid-binding protein